MRVRALANGNVYDVVDGEPQTAGQISRAQVESLSGFAIFETLDEPALRAPEAPLRTVAHTEPVAKRTSRSRKGR